MEDTNNRDSGALKGSVSIKNESTSRRGEQAAEVDDPRLGIEDLILKVEDFVADDIRDIETLVLPDEDLERFPDPQITSSDPFERRVARRLRIRNKLREKKRQEEARLKEELGEEEDEEEKYDPDNVVESQLESSTVRLLELIQDGKELISNIKVAAVSYEVKRRDKVRLERAERRDKLEQAAEEARIRFMEISNQWAAVKSEKDPLDIHTATENQREKCMEVIARKDSIIQELKDELEEADENFVKDLERQEEEINILVDRINQQINIMRTAANNEIDLLEAAIAVERGEMMKANEKEWDELIERKEFIESETNVMRNEIMDKHEKALDAMETEQREQLKIKRTEQTKVIHEMQLQLQELEALCLFNSEKLNHNYRVLKKRADENQIIKSEQKRTITKLQDIVSSLRKKLQKKETALWNDTKRMTNELSYLNKSIKDLELRAIQFAAKNNKKFLSLWQFNQNQAEELIQQIMNGDKIMYEQFLDIAAPPSLLPTIKKEDLPSFKSFQKSSEEKSEAENETKCTEDETNIAVDENKVLKTILKSVSKYASFLIEENVRNVINEFSPADQVIVRLDKILTTIGVKNESEIRLLVKHFLPHLFCKTCLEWPSSEDTTSEVEIEDKPFMEYEDCQDEIIDEVITRLRLDQEWELEQREVKMKDVMEALSTSVKDRITVIDKVVSQELEVTKQEQSNIIAQPQAETQSVYSLLPLLKSDIKRETIEIMPGDLNTYNMLMTEDRLSQPTVSTAIFQMDSKKGRKNSLITCLQAKHELSIDRLLLVKALYEYSKVLNKRTQETEVTPLADIILDKWATVTRSITNEDIDTFWKSFDVISKDKEHLWDTFTEGMKEYHKELTERDKLNEEIKKMKRNNNDLMRLLQRYLSVTIEESSEISFPKIRQYFPCPEVDEQTKEATNEFLLTKAQ